MMQWSRDKLVPVEQHLYLGRQVRIGLFDCPGDDDCFPVTESVQNNLFVLATKSLWIRRNTRGFRYVGPGSVLLHPSGCTIERQRETGIHDRTYWFAIRPDIYAEVLARYGLGKRLPTDALCPDSSLQLNASGLIQRLRAGTATPLEIESRVIALLDEICASMSRSGRAAGLQRKTSRSRAKRLADSVKSFVDSHLSENRDLDAIADAVGASPYHLCRVFKAENGITLHEYRMRQRLAFVIRKLGETPMVRLVDLALDAGFSSHSHLSHVFADRFRTTPSAYRQMLHVTPDANKVLPRQGPRALSLPT